MFFKSGTDERLITYKDELESPGLENVEFVPVNPDGNVANVFFSGSAKVKYLDQFFVQYAERDPVGGSTSLADFSSWVITISYDKNDFVEGEDGKFYKSLLNGNEGNDPSTTPEAWEEVRFLGVYNENVTYDTGYVTQTTDGNLWKSAVDGNTGNNPTTDNNVNWTPATSAASGITTIGLISSVIPVNAGDSIETSGFYSSSDGAGAKWKFTGNTITASQSPSQTGTGKLSNGNGSEFELVITNNRVVASKLGVLSDGSTDDYLAWVATLSAGTGGVCEAATGATSVSSQELSIPGNTILDLSGGTIKADPSLPSTDNLVRVATVNARVINGNIDVNKSNLINTFLSGSVGSGIIVSTGAVCCKFLDLKIKNSPTNGLVIFGNGVSDIEVNSLLTEDNGFTGCGCEIQNNGAGNNPSNIRFLNIKTKGNTLGGIRVAGCNGFYGSNLVTEEGGNSGIVLYVGDSKGGLTDCKLVNCTIGTSNAAVTNIEIDGEVRTGPFTGDLAVCEVELVNVHSQSAGGGTSINIRGGAIVRFANLSGDNATNGFVISESSFASGNNIKMSNMGNRAYTIDSLVDLTNVVAENWGAAADAIFVTTNSSNSVLHNCRLGALSGETGQDGFGSTGTPAELNVSIKSFAGSGNRTAGVISSVLAGWVIDDLNSQRIVRMIDGVVEPATIAGTGQVYIDAITGDYNIKFGDGVIKTIALNA